MILVVVVKITIRQKLKAYTHNPNEAIRKQKKMMYTTLPLNAARMPSNEPFSAAPPLDGAGDPTDLAGSPRTGGSVSGLEVGIIVGVVIAVTLLLVTIFVWRARKNKKVEQDRLAADMVGDAESCRNNDDGNSSSRASREEADDGQQHSIGFIVTNIADTDKILTAERPERAAIFGNARGGGGGGVDGTERAGWADWSHNMGSQQRRDGKFSCVSHSRHEVVALRGLRRLIKMRDSRGARDSTSSPSAQAMRFSTILREGQHVSRATCSIRYRMGIKTRVYAGAILCCAEKRDGLSLK